MGVLFVYIVTLGNADVVQALTIGATRTALVWVQFALVVDLVVVVVSFINQALTAVVGLLDQL